MPPQGPGVSSRPSYGAPPSTSAESGLVAGAPGTTGGEVFHIGDPLMQSLKLAREAELRGDVKNAALFYDHTVTYVVSDSKFRPLPTVAVGGESLSSIARRDLFYTLQVDRQKLAAPQDASAVERILKNLQSMYEKMETIEPNDPTWPYLGGVMYAAGNDYRTAAIKLAQCLKTTGGEPSVRNKARTLLAHIEPGARQQQQWYEQDWAAYEEYVRSGRQARDTLRGMLRFNTQDAERKGDLPKADYYRQQERALPP